MNLSKIIRNADDLDYRRVTMSDLGTVTQAETGGFVVLDSSIIDQTNVENSVSLQESIAESVDELKQQHLVELEAKFEQGRKSGIAEVERSLSTVTKSLASA